jgi:hypothetical protein
LLQNSGTDHKTCPHLKTKLLHRSTHEAATIGGSPGMNGRVGEQIKYLG